MNTEIISGLIMVVWLAVVGLLYYLIEKED